MCELPEIKYNEFDDIQASTRTIIVQTNLIIDTTVLFEKLPITEYICIPKRRGRKKKVVVSDPNKNIDDGSIITLDLSNNIRGVVLKKKKTKQGSKGIKYFRNSITVVMIVDGKKINFKMTKNGKFQITGCKNAFHAEQVVKYIWKYIREDHSIYTLIDDEKNLKALFIPAMRNIDFSLGFSLNKERLDEFFNKQTKYYSLLEPSIGYTGVNIKTRLEKPINDLIIKQLIYDNDTDDWKEPIYVKYQSYIDTLSLKDQKKILDKPRFTTFLVFHSGKCIMSSICEDIGRDIYYDFIKIVSENYKYFKEENDK